MRLFDDMNEHGRNKSMYQSARVKKAVNVKFLNQLMKQASHLDEEGGGGTCKSPPHA